MRKASLALAALVILGGTNGVVRLAWAETGAQNGNKVENTPSPSPRPSPQGERGELPPGAGSKVEVAVKDGKVSVDLVGAELGEVLRRLSQAAGIEITVGEGVAGKVSMKFSDLPLREGLEKIIGQSDYALEYTGEGLSKVRLTNKKGEAGKQAGTSAKQAEGCKVEFDEKAKVLKFLDCKGKVIKQVDAKCSSEPYITKNNKYAAMEVIVADNPEAAERRTKEGYGCFGVIEAGYGHAELLLMDNAGNVLWSKRIAGQRFAEKIIMSDNAEAVVFLTGEADEGFSDEMVEVLNNAGENILNIPKDLKTLKQWHHRPQEYTLSSNGRYLGVKFSFNLTGFYDLESGTSWELPEYWAVDSISNDGKAEISFQSERKEIDLKDYLGTK